MVGSLSIASRTEIARFAIKLKHVQSPRAAGRGRPLSLRYERRGDCRTTSKLWWSGDAALFENRAALYENEHSSKEKICNPGCAVCAVSRHEC
jgi:hypothetical protein